MPKRKASNNDNDGLARPSPKRVTRSTSAAAKPDSDAKPATTASTTTRRRGRPPANVAPTPTEPEKPTRRTRRENARTIDTSSLKENEQSDEDGDEGRSSDDELQLAPENKRPRDVARGKRVVFDSVEIVALPVRTARVYRRSGKTSVISSARSTAASAVDEQHHVQETTLPSGLQKRSSLKEEVPSHSTIRLPATLPPSLHSCLNAQKRAILSALNDLPGVDYSSISREAEDSDDDDEVANVTAFEQLTSLLNGTITRSEGNSCLLLGPAGSGKSRIFERALSATCTESTIIIRLSGNVHTTDRLALREIARQVVKQSGPSFASSSIDDFFSGDADADAEVSLSSSALPAAHLPALVSSLSSLSKPVIILLDQFEMFADHGRQALLYCLFDAVQSCRGSGVSRSSGLAVIGLTSRIDVINLLEKRVKSRFSHRVLRTAAMKHPGEWIEFARRCLCVEASSELGAVDENVGSEWSRMWRKSVDNFLGDRAVKDCLNETFGITRDVRVLINILMGAVVSLTPTSPFLSAQSLKKHTQAQRNQSQFPMLSRSSYPCLSLLVAAEHARVAGHDSFTFEMLYDMFRTQVRTSSAAPVQLGGVGIGMVGVGRGVMMGSFEQLMQNRIFVPSGVPVSGLAKEFIKHRSLVGREEVKAVVERQAPTSLKKWLKKAL